MREPEFVLVVIQRVERAERSLDQKQPDRGGHAEAPARHIVPAYRQINRPRQSTVTSTTHPGGAGDARAAIRGAQACHTGMPSTRIARCSKMSDPSALRS